MIYCNFISYSFFGDKQIPILKQIPVSSPDKQYLTHQYSIKDLKPIVLKEIRNLKFSLRLINGELINIIDKDSELLLNIEFIKL